jgi:hypothetical protein
MRHSHGTGTRTAQPAPASQHRLALCHHAATGKTLRFIDYKSE